jgi:hypothetical protein
VSNYIIKSIQNLFKKYSTNRFNIYIRGHIFVYNTALEGKNMSNFINDSLSLDNVNDFVDKIDGFFSIIIENEDLLLIIVDKVRSIPVFTQNVQKKA